MIYHANYIRHNFTTATNDVTDANTVAYYKGDTANGVILPGQQITWTVPPPEEEPPPPPRRRPWTVLQQKPKTPFFVARPEFHARSNPQRR